MSRKTVVVGMSGGVDSSVAAYLLKEEGLNVIGVTMRIWQDESEEKLQEQAGCCGLFAVQDARRVSGILDIPHYVMNFRDVFRDKVIDYFVNEYLNARTPNPCIACNRYVKWEALLKRSMDIGADYIATGHYARIKRLENGRYAVGVSAAEEKDQTYALYSLTQEQLKHTLMPLGTYTKPQVRRLAEEAGLPVAQKAESQEICFIPDNDYASFVEKHSDTTMPEGNFVTSDGKILGRHKGLHRYTVGQRRGLSLPMGHRVFVKALNPSSNEVVIAEDKDMYTNTVKAKELKFMGLEDLVPGSRETFIGKIRYGHAGAECTATRTGKDEIICDFAKPVRAAAPGQALVLYRKDHIALGGIIQ